MNGDIISKMIKLNGELAKVILNYKPLHEIDILLQSESLNSLEENQINLSYFRVDEIFEGKELTCKEYIQFLRKNFFYKNDFNPKTKALESRPLSLLNKTITQANKDNVFLKDLKSFDYKQNIVLIINKKNKFF